MKTQIDGIKGEYSCNFHKDCNKCNKRNVCISATSFTNSPRRYFFYRLGYKEPRNEAMKTGKAKHIETLKDLKTAEEYKFENIRKDLFKNKTVKLQEIQVCSPYHSLRGVIDEFWMSLAGNTINISAKEYKSIWYKKYFNQLAIYGIILSDPHARMVYTIKKRKERRITKPLYPQTKQYKLNIDLTLQVFDKKPSPPLNFMENNLMTDWGNGIFAYVSKLAKEFRKLHKLNYYYLAELPLCKNCWKYCGYRDRCEKAPYKTEGKKLHQLHYGKKTLLIKTKPIINIARIMPLKSK